MLTNLSTVPYQGIAFPNEWMIKYLAMVYFSTKCTLAYKFREKIDLIIRK